jgi:hypothetical protein
LAAGDRGDHCGWSMTDVGDGRAEKTISSCRISVDDGVASPRGDKPSGELADNALFSTGGRLAVARDDR